MLAVLRFEAPDQPPVAPVLKRSFVFRIEGECAFGFINAGRTVFGDVLTFDVPCLKIDLKPKEKS